MIRLHFLSLSLSLSLSLIKHTDHQISQSKISNIVFSPNRSKSSSCGVGMAYIPPHKRHSKDAERPSPTPELLVPQFKQNLNLRSFKSDTEKRKDKHYSKAGKIIYSKQSISRWFALCLEDNNQFPSSARLEPISLESIERKIGEKPRVLVLDSLLRTENDEVRGNSLQNPWVSVVENIKQDLLASFESVRNEIECQTLEEVKPNLVARFGKILFHGSPSVNLETVDRSSVSETTLRRFKRSFYTNCPLSYMEYVTNEIVPKIGLDFEEEKEIYHVKLSDSVLPDLTISCKCSVMKDDKKLELYKIESNQVRHLVVDISCLERKQDLRLMLRTKRILTALTDDEKNSIRSLISSAVLDPDVKGGLRWPLGKESSEDRYTVIGVWHTNAKMFRSASLRLKVQHADRFDFRTSIGEVTGEVNLKMIGVVSQLQERMVDIDLVSEMLKENIKLIWNHFLCCDCAFT